MDQARLQHTVATLRSRLLAARQAEGHWIGHLSSSALSTATAVFALAQVNQARYQALIERGLRWLCMHQNADGGWGDTVGSPSNLSTTMLCYCALAIADAPSECVQALARTEAWLQQTVGSREPAVLARAVDQAYGKDRTFSVPILTMCALAGRLGDGADAWRPVRALPFELAVLPHRLFKWLRLPVVSYALPALIAMGQVRYAHRKPRCPVSLVARSLAGRRSLDVLSRIQPDNGGFLEAAPLTSFVVMSLARCGHRDHEVVRKGVDFLVASIRDDGSWPIDTNLAMWVTTLSIAALSCDEGADDLSASERQRLLEWLLAGQHGCVHPYTQAAPGGWAWTNLAGAVPDADDTAGVLLALHRLGADAPDISESAVVGIKWLLDLQNSDGGIPTFCRGWTKLPFDKSAPDITAHMIAAVGAWLRVLPEPMRPKAEQAVLRGLDFLRRAQDEKGAWLPLWFGNQLSPNKENPVYGTSRALTHFAQVPNVFRGGMMPMYTKALHWLLSAQNADGGWGGTADVASSIEETALAVDALAESLLGGLTNDEGTVRSAVQRGADWLMVHANDGASTPASPIGLYFAHLWYSEALYPLVFTLGALGKVQHLLRSH